MSSYLLTGAAGFIGSHLGNRLVEEGNTVFGIDNYLHPSDNTLNFKCERADVRFLEYVVMRAKNSDCIVHLAAAINVDWSHVLPDLAYEINLNGTLNVLETARKLDLPMVYASSSEIYGTAQATTISERHQLDGQSPYAASKTAADRACKAWRDTYGMKINIVRTFNTFGPYQAEDGYGGVIAKFTRQCLRGEPMTVYGTGRQRRDYLWIDDAVDAYLLALSKDFKEPVNFGTGTTVTILEIAENVARLAGKPYHAAFLDPRPGEVYILRCDASRARELGWSLKVTFIEGLKMYIDWAKSRTT